MVKIARSKPSCKCFIFFKGGGITIDAEALSSISRYNEASCSSCLIAKVQNHTFGGKDVYMVQGRVLVCFLLVCPPLIVEFW